MYTRLGKDFFEQSGIILAKSLLGKRFVKLQGQETLSFMITETEAYMGPIDKAAHSCRGKTNRNQVMWESGGKLYVYQIYGLYFCMNIVADKADQPCAVLIRSGQPLENISKMYLNARKEQMLDKKGLITVGPSRLCLAMGIDKTYNGIDLVESDELYVTDYQSILEDDIAATPRINIDYAEEAVNFPWRFFIKNNPYVSGTKKQNAY